MKPTSKVIKTFMVNHEYSRTGGDEYQSQENNNHLIVHCEDGSIWKTTQDILYTEDEDWKCILEAPEDETKNMVANFLLVGDDQIGYFIRNGWEIVSSAPNPHPCPYIIFSIRKYFDKQLTKKEEMILRHKAILDFEHYNRSFGESFWEEVHKQGDLEFAAELKSKKE